MGVRAGGADVGKVEEMQGDLDGMVVALCRCMKDMVSLSKRFTATTLSTFLATLTIAAGCGSSDPEPPSISAFTASGCKTQVTASTGGANRCVGWEISGTGSTVFTLSGFAELCGTPESLWKADARLVGDTLEVAVTWNFATPNACGVCEQDYSIAVSGLRTEAVKKLRIVTKGCTGDCAAHSYLVDVGGAGMSGLSLDAPICGVERVVKE